MMNVEKSKYLTNLDLIDIYGWAMPVHLQLCKFKLLADKDMKD